MRKINTVVFDYDGTIHDTSKVYIAAFKKVYGELVADGYAPEREFEDSEITQWLGCTATEMWNTFMPFLSDDMKHKGAKKVGVYIAELIHAGKSSLYDGMKDVFRELNGMGIKLAVLSNCADHYMNHHREHFGLDEFFSKYYCAARFDFISKSEIFKQYIKNELPGGYCMVGDRFHDMEAGKDNCLLTVGCAYGFGKEGELDSADVVIDSIRKLPKIITDFENNN